MTRAPSRVGAGAREYEPVEEAHRAVHASVTVVVVEHRDAPRGRALVLPIHVAHVAAHLDDPQASVAVEHGLHRRLDERLGGDEFSARAGRALECPERLLRRERRRYRGHDPGREWRLRLAGPVALLRQGDREQYAGRPGRARANLHRTEATPVGARRGRACTGSIARHDSGPFSARIECGDPSAGGAVEVPGLRR